MYGLKRGSASTHHSNVDDLKVVATKLELIDEVEALMKERFGEGLSVSEEIVNMRHINQFGTTFGPG